MHSSRVRTGRSLNVCRSLLLKGGGLDLIPLNFPFRCGPGSDPPQFPPWVWAWRGVPPSWGVLLPRGPTYGGSPCRGVSLPWGVSFWGGLLLGVPPSWGPPSGGVPPSWAISLPGGASFLGGLLQGGVSLLGGSPCQGSLPPSRGVVSQHALRQTPPLWTEWQTGVKILPCPKLRRGR